jgi:uncharacterized membrane protein YkoI
MKKSIFIQTIFVGVALTSCAQNAAPKVVSDAFTAKFPTAKSVNWDKENDQEWEAEFKMDGKEYSANFSIGGEWLETEQEIKKSALPTEVLSTIAANFADYKIDEAEKAETKTGTVYEVILEKGEAEIEVVFDVTGKILSQKVHQEEEEEMK